jgi:hypothetical protein
MDVRKYTAGSLVMLALVLSAILPQAQSAITGKVDFPYLGITFVAPAGWRGQEDGDYMIFAHNTEPGLVGLTLNPARTIEQLRNAADAGWIEDNIALNRSGPFERIGAEGMAAEFSGYFHGQSAKAYIAGIINPYGRSVTIIALTSTEKYGQQQTTLVKSIAASLQFAVPQESPHVPEWRQALAGRTLTYLQSSGSSGTPYTDSSGQIYGSYSSYSSRHEMHLCSDKSFYSSNSSSSSFDAIGGFGYIGGSGNGHGKWNILTGADGEAILTLKFNDGQVSEYELSNDAGKTKLNGSRYFRTVSEQCN